MTNQLSFTRFKDSSLFYVVILVLFQLAAIAFISPAGNFPLNDDWGYAEPVRIYMQTGQFVIPTALAAGFLHIMLGAVVCKIFGYSYVVLRCITLFISLIGTVALFYALKEARVRRNLALLCCLIYAFNPLLMNVEFTYLSDVAALTFTNIYLLFLLRCVRKDSVISLLIAALSLIAAVTVRQSTVIFGISSLFALISIYRKPVLRIAMPLLLVALPIVAYVLIDNWLLHRYEIANYYLPIRAQHNNFIKEIFRNPISSGFAITVALGQVACYLALFCAPLLISFSSRIFTSLKKHARINAAWLVFAATVVCTALIKLVKQDHRLMPFDQNLLRIPNVGALGIMGVNIPILKPKPRTWLTGVSGLLAFFLISVFGAGFQRAFEIGYRAVKKIQNKSYSDYMLKRASIITICFVSGALSVCFVTMETVIRCFDKYYLLAFAPVLLCLAITYRWLSVKSNLVLPVVLLIGLGLYSTLAAQDYLSWNRARWKALTFLEAQGIKSSQIDGGAEYNFLRDMTLYKSNYTGEPPRNKWRWWQVHSEDYIISFSPIPEYDVIHQETYWSGLTFHKGEVLVLKHLKSAPGN